ncbi:hypothetical protein BJ165DRAFT_1416198 [Panaeolus papilionaceus]|nr:hypothetical protein BJ165DRAFT_1416198 [Panaeolus papilionaceus]
MSQTLPVDTPSATITPAPGDNDDQSALSSPSQSSLSSGTSTLSRSLSENSSDTHSPSSTTSGPRSSISFIPANAAVGGLLFTQPPATVTSFYKIAPSQFITFGWNLTSLSVTPTKLTFSAVCENGNTYPVGPTDGVVALSGEVVWDVNSYQVANPDTPLVQAKYTLHVWDERGPNAPRRGGYFQHNSAVQFALYTPQPYTPLTSGWTCAACSGASTYAAHPASISIVITLFITFLSGLHLVRSMRGAQVG